MPRETAVPARFLRNPCDEAAIQEKSAEPQEVDSAGRPISRYETLFRVSEAINEYRDPQQLFQKLADELRRVLDFNYVLVLLWNEITQTMEKHMFGIVDLPDGMLPPPFNTDQTIAYWVYQHQESIVIPCIENETRFPVVVEFLKKFGIHSICGFPLTTAHRKLGVLAFGSKLKDAYSPNDVCFLSLVASEVAVAIDDALNFEALKRAQSDLQTEHERLKLLLDLTNSVASNLNLNEVVRAISANLRSVMKCDVVGVHLADAEQKNLRLVALDFPESKGFFVQETLIPMEGTVLGSVYRERRPRMMEHPDPSRMTPEEYRKIVGEGIQSACLLPLMSRNRTLGVLALGRLEENAFSEEDVSFLTQVANQLAFAVENALAYQEIATLKDKLAQEKLYLEDEIRSTMDFQEIIGESPLLLNVLQQIETVAPTDSTVLILGETGTGKELVARAIHNRSKRKDRTFVKLNCAAIPTGLLESELFGHERGAFTGAISQRIGRMELADQGTLFLDEIGDIPLELQSKLLRALQEREFERLGSTKTIKVDVRLVAATNRDLQKMVAEGQFRSDLYYRLNVFPIRVPALRERNDDIPLLVRHFTQKYARRLEKNIESIPSNTLKQLSRWQWPGNVRELENFIERAVILTQGTVLNAPLAEMTNGPVAPNSIIVDSMERDQILRALRETKGRVGGSTGAAELLGIKRTTLIARMKKLGINPRQYS
jgi:formate hydrogenlyase transcriptional activator